MAIFPILHCVFVHGKTTAKNQLIERVLLFCHHKARSRVQQDEYASKDKKTNNGRLYSANRFAMMPPIFAFFFVKT